MYVLIFFRIIKSYESPIDKPLLYVASAGAGALSIYEIVDANPVIPGPAWRLWLHREQARTLFAIGELDYFFMNEFVERIIEC